MSDKNLREKIKENQLDEKYSEREVLNIPGLNTYFTLNKIHCIELGVVFGIVTGLIFQNISHVVGVMVLIDLSFSPIGFSFITATERLTVPNYPFTFTVRAEPWWFLTFLLGSFLFSVYGFSFLIQTGLLS